MNRQPEMETRRSRVRARISDVILQDNSRDHWTNRVSRADPLVDQLLDSGR
jgi:hypothetical protein